MEGEIKVSMRRGIEGGREGGREGGLATYSKGMSFARSSLFWRYS